MTELIKNIFMLKFKIEIFKKCMYDNCLKTWQESASKMIDEQIKTFYPTEG